MNDLLFSHCVKPVQVEELTFQLCFINDLDEVLDYYIKNSPSDTDKIPYFTRLWEAAEALSKYLVRHKDLIAGKKVLELGCGLGLPSFCAAKCGAIQVMASDFHPDNRAFFLKNAALNELTNVDYFQMDWREPTLEGQYNLIVGSDLIYEKTFVPALAGCIDKYLATNGLFVYADPGRTALQNLASLLQKAGFDYDIIPDGDIWIMPFQRR